MPLFVIFTRAARRPAHNDDCDPFTKNVGHHYVEHHQL
jgi:hypothetical protein